MVRRVSCSIPNNRVIAPNTIATSEKDVTKPSAMKTGLALFVCPTDEPSRIGKTGKVHGAAIVRMPASRERITVAIQVAPINDH